MLNQSSKGLALNQRWPRAAPKPGAGLGRRLAEVHPETDTELVLALRQGEQQAAARLYDHHAAAVHRLVHRLLGSSDQLDDIVQEVFIYALYSIQKLREPAALKGWLFGIAVGKVRAHLRKRARHRWLSFLPTEQLPEPSVDLGDPDAELVSQVTSLLEHLRPEERIAIVVRHIQELPLDEAAKVSCMSPSTFRRRLLKGEARFMELTKKDPALGHFWGGGSS